MDDCPKQKIYDANGNLKKDLNKDIGNASTDGIVYNYLNLPQTITVRKDAGGANVKGTIEYVYDATGNKLCKKTTEGSTITKTTYTSGFVYESKTGVQGGNDVLQFTGHEEGRIRPVFDNNNVQINWTYDYMLKDHLGNVRMVLTEEQKTDLYPAATLEGLQTAGALSMLNYEKQFYSITNAYITPKANMPGWTTAKDYANNNGNPPDNARYPSNYTSTPNATSNNTYRLNASTNKTGLGMVVKVMAGDRVDIFGKSYYQSTTVYNNGNSTAITVANILAGFLASPDNAGFASKGVTASNLQNTNSSLPTMFTTGGNGESTTIPKAYINYIFFDEQFKYAGGGVSRAGTSGVVKNHGADLFNIPVPKNGYLYVYVSNESNADVFFDNVQVAHTRGAMLEENHYYPFGLRMEGISSKAAGGIQNSFKYNGGNELQSKEFSDGGGLELYDAMFRMYDPQLGRFHKIDPLADFFDDLTPYNFAYNNPIYFNDPFGLSPNKENGTQNLTGYVEKPDGTIYYDPNVHKQEDLDPKSGLKYSRLG
jgi:RHS repeat-associated protein